MSTPAPASSGQKLAFADVADLRKELGAEVPAAGASTQAAVAEPAIGAAAAPQETAPVDPALARQADDVVARILKLDLDDASAQDSVKAAMEAMGSQVQREAARRSAMLKQPLATLMKTGEDGGPVAKSLIDLKIQVEDLDPAQLDMSAGWFSRLVGKTPVVGTGLKRYFSKFEMASTTIDAIVNSLQKGQDQLKRDNITLTEDQKAMRALTVKLEQAIKLAQAIDAKLQGALDNEIPQSDRRYKFVAEELLFPLRQRIQDLQQQLLVNQQGFLTMEMVIRNNKELIRGVNRALNVTVNALQTGVTLALALANQKIVLAKVQAVTATTDKLLADNAARLKTQGTEIQKQASSTQLNIETLKKSFADIRDAIDDISRYRQEALPKMAQNILDMDRLAAESAETIQRVEHAEKVARDFPIEIVN